MHETALKVAMGGLSHDLGKFVDMTILDPPEGYLENNAGVFLPVWNGNYSHWHALYTAAFIEKMSSYFP
ncbi:hypothetical protein, partial [Desulfamplus magnetovallimortis]|uniref:hypothetical protein n=1 Tax=Desulfamplus magnetovallimortis TaxID=1246637 RepID=UPI001644DE71